MRPVSSEHTVPWLRIVATRDVDTANRWRDAIAAGGGAVEVHIEDPRDALPGTSGVAEIVLGATFAYGVYVPPDDRAQALRMLIDAGWDGRHGLVDAPATGSRKVLRGALLAVAAAAAIAVLRVALG
jgi:hypothetical protein